MLITIFLLILGYSVLGKPVGKLVDKVKNVDWDDLSAKAWSSVKSFGLKAGRTACKPLLYFYYVMKDEGTSVADKALVYGALLYIVIPCDLLPRRVLGMLGMLDDAAVTAFVLKKIKDKITPEIEMLANTTLDEWFGAEGVTIL